MTHNHHIIPKHAGGTNDPSNLIRLTISGHSFAHWCLWMKFGRLQDKMAWLMLAGKTEEGELALHEMLREIASRVNMGNTHRTGKRVPYKARPKAVGRIGSMLGRKHTDETKKKMRAAKIGTHQSIEHLAARAKAVTQWWAKRKAENVSN